MKFYLKIQHLTFVKYIQKLINNSFSLSFHENVISLLNIFEKYLFMKLNKFNQIQIFILLGIFYVIIFFCLKIKLILISL
jgi:hypothetical protein